MHDFLQIIGVARDASAREVRRATARRVQRTHPDFGPGDVRGSAARAGGRGSDLPGWGDTAIDFVDMAAVVERMQAAFFDSRASRRSPCGLT